MQMTLPRSDDRTPQPDPAEDNAFFPSPYSLSQFTAPKSDLSGADYPQPYAGGRWKVLVIGADERYLMTGNGTMVSTGNHPVETLCRCITSTRPDSTSTLPRSQAMDLSRFGAAPLRA